MSNASYEFLNDTFLKAMDEIGRYGFEKYGKDSFQSRQFNENRRGDSQRCQMDTICEHMRQHIYAYSRGEKHDHFDTLKHQLAAVAFNAMMEFHFAYLEKEETNASTE